jgi:hypothetical protein
LAEVGPSSEYIGTKQWWALALPAVTAMAAVAAAATTPKRRSS